MMVVKKIYTFMELCKVSQLIQILMKSQYDQVQYGYWRSHKTTVLANVNQHQRAAFFILTGLTTVMSVK